MPYFMCRGVFLLTSPTVTDFYCTMIHFSAKCSGIYRQLLWHLWAGKRSLYSDWLRAGQPGDRISVDGEIFRLCPDRPWGPPSLLYNGYRVFPGGKEQPRRDADPSLPSSAVGHERVERYLYSPYGPYGLYRASVPGQGWPLPLPLHFVAIFPYRLSKFLFLSIEHTSTPLFLILNLESYFTVLVTLLFVKTCVPDWRTSGSCCYTKYMLSVMNCCFTKQREQLLMLFY